MAAPSHPGSSDVAPAGDASRPTGASSTASTDERRGFFAQALAIAAGGAALLVPLTSGLVVFFDPLWRNGMLGKLIPVAPVSGVPQDGLPHQFPVVAERVDAWNRSLAPVGAVYLRRDQAVSSLKCLSATCPHAGCFVNFDPQIQRFKCPCHNSEFALDGSIIEPSPSPRPMDSLQCEVRGDEILVKFEEFYSGRADKVVKG
jgi:Rieske Fe-S protein